MSEVQICNRALQKLGAAPIVALSDDNHRARTMQLAYASVRDAELKRNRWKFSLLRTSLAALAEAPAHDYLRQFPVPNDYLGLIEGGDITTLIDMSDYRGSAIALYSIEGRNILTNLSAPLKIRYIAQVVDTALFDVAFSEALSSRLAYECCETITQSDSKRQLAAGDYKMAMGEARRSHAIESPPQDISDDSWILARAR